MTGTTPEPRPLETPAPIGEPRADALRRLIAVVDRLRDPESGCPWDLEQTLESLAPHVIEEGHEVVEAIESGDDAHIEEELGDLLMGIVLQARVAEQGQRFDLAGIANKVCDKLVRRHPHVFGGGESGDAQWALESWEAVKKKERAGQQDRSALAGVPVGMPALQRARRLGDKAIAAGFRWDDVAGSLAKLEEEIRELRVELEAAGDVLESPRGGLPDEARERVEEELGDVLFAGALLGSYLQVDPEQATRGSIRRFERRFRRMEAALGDPSQHELPALIEAWNAAKAAEDAGERSA